MNEQNQVSSSIPSPEVTVKRKRGRPRKDQGQNPAKIAYVPRKRDPSQNYGESVPVPPEFERANGNQPLSVDTVHVSNGNSMVGQAVTGVIEATFDAGFLVSIRVGDSDTSLRGVVFKPGHYVPVSTENDVAPSLQMIPRNEVPFPVGNQGQKRRGREQSEHHQSRQMPIVVAQAPSPLEARGTVVPVVLQPVDISNGAVPIIEAPPIASEPAHMGASKSEHIPSTQFMQEAMPKGSETDSGSASQPFEELVIVAKKMQGSPNLVEAQKESGELPSKKLPNDSGFSPKEVQDLSKPLSVEPLQAIGSGLPDQSASISHAFPERRAGKMTELLLAVQENLMERQMAESQHQEFRNPEN